MKKEIVEKESREIVEGKITLQELQTQVQLVHEVMKNVMIKGKHYDKILGCGDKYTLLKSGAEKIALTFKLRPIIVSGDILVEKFDNGHREITVSCHIMNHKCEEIATGIGSCSTMESKYKYRGGSKESTGVIVPTEYWNLRKEGKLLEAKKLIGGEGFGVAKIDGEWQICIIGEKTENSDIADTYNTVLKMAKKRAYVDGILSATGASDIFTQDINDSNTSQTSNDSNTSQTSNDSATKNSAKPQTTQPQAKPQTTQPQKTQPLPFQPPISQDIILDVYSASNDEIGKIINVVGELYEFKEAKVGKKQTDITYYTIIDPENENIKINISKWGKKNLNIEIGNNLIFKKVVISEYNNKKQYFAEEIENLNAKVDDIKWEEEKKQK